MYGIFTYIYQKNQLNVAKYTIHGSYGYWLYVFCSEFLKKMFHLLESYDFSAIETTTHSTRFSPEQLTSRETRETEGSDLFKPHDVGLAVSWSTHFEVDVLMIDDSVLRKYPKLL